MGNNYDDFFLERYSCNLVLDGFGFCGQERLKNSRVLVVGLGGIGCVISTYLVGNGIGKIGICDYDYVQPNNLTRQILYDIGSLGKPKVLVAYERLLSCNNEVDINPVFEKIDESNAANIFSDYELIIDATDSQDTKFLVNQVSRKMHKKAIICSAISYEGNIVRATDENEACWQCIFESKIPHEKLPTCNETGVFPTIPAIIGLVATTEIIKELTGIFKSRENFIKVNIRENSIRYLYIKKRPDCNLH
ncbi:MAG: HesA/MoeB/ThiF family protein [Planctomycetota bacterium]